MAAALPSLSLSYLDEFLPGISPTTRTALAAAMDAHDRCAVWFCGGCLEVAGGVAGGRGADGRAASGGRLTPQPRPGRTSPPPGPPPGGRRHPAPARHRSAGGTRVRHEQRVGPLHAPVRRLLRTDPRRVRRRGQGHPRRRHHDGAPASFTVTNTFGTPEAPAKPTADATAADADDGDAADEPRPVTAS